MILALVRYLTLCNGCQPRTQALFSARYSRSLGTRLRRCGTSCTKRNRDYSRRVTTPRGIHQLLVCLAVPRKCNFSRNFFSPNCNQNPAESRCDFDSFRNISVAANSTHNFLFVFHTDILFDNGPSYQNH